MPSFNLNCEQYKLPQGSNSAGPKWFLNQKDINNDYIDLPSALPLLRKPRNLNNADLNAIAQLSAVSPLSELALPPLGKEKVMLAAAVIDTGIAPHEKLNVIKWLNSTGNQKELHDIQGHGTHIAGIIGAKKTSVKAGSKTMELEGMVPNAPLVSVRVTSKKSSSTHWYNIVNGLKKVIEYNEDEKNKIKISVVNLSFNAFDNLIKQGKMVHHELYKMIANLYELRIPVVVSGGNHFEHFMEYGLAYPANCELVISAGPEVMHAPPMYVRADLAPLTQRVEDTKENLFLAAPGMATVSTSPDDGYSLLSGSSASAPVITGIILRMQHRAITMKKFNYSLPPIEDLKAALRRGADKLANRGNSNSLSAIPRSNTFFDNRMYLHSNAINMLNQI